MRLKLIFTFCLHVLFGIGVIQSQNISLNIKKLDGTEKSIQLSQLKKITFSGTNMILNYQTLGTENIGLSLIQKVTFGTFTALSNTYEADNTLSVYPNPSSDVIHIKNLTCSAQEIAIYSVNGCKVLDFNVVGNKVDIGCLTKGIYFIKINNQTIKFAKL